MVMLFLNLEIVVLGLLHLFPDGSRRRKCDTILPVCMYCQGLSVISLLSDSTADPVIVITFFSSLSNLFPIV